MAKIQTGMDIRTVPVSQMKPAKYNPRKDLCKNVKCKLEAFSTQRN